MAVLRSRLFTSWTFLNSLQDFKPVYHFWSVFLPLQSLIWASVAVPLCTKITADYSEWSLGFISRFGDKHFWASILGIALSSVCQGDISLHFLQKTKGIFFMYRHWCVISSLRQMSAVSTSPFIPSNVFFQTLLWQVCFLFRCADKNLVGPISDRRMHQPDDSCRIDDVIFWSVFALETLIGLLEQNIIPLKWLPFSSVK